MNESWMQLVVAAVLGWGAWELRQLRHDVGHRIHYADCERRMNEHGRRLNRLEEEIR